MNDKLILLVEDNPDDELLTLRVFRKSSIKNRVTLVHTGHEALAYLHGTDNHTQRHAPILPDVILLDLKLPHMSGLEVLRRIRAAPTTKLLPVVILTSSLEPSDLITSYRLGANSYVRKPVDFSQFVEIANRLLAYWLLVNELPPPVPSTDEDIP